MEAAKPGSPPDKPVNPADKPANPVAEKTPVNAEAAKLQEQVANAEREMLKLEQQINKYQSIPRSSTGETHPLGNAPTPDPVEPTVNEPGNVYLQTPPDPAAAVPPKPPVKA
jgi:hypothetical protein